MTTWGVTAQGFLAKPLSQVQSEIDAGLQGILGASSGTEPDGTIPLASAAGQLKTLLTDGFAACWDLQQAVYATFNPQTASGAGLDQDCALTGTERQPSAFSTVTGTCCGTPNTSLAPGRVATVQGTNARFDSTVAGGTLVIAALTAWAQSHAYNLGDRVTANNLCFQCTQAGTSLGSGAGPTGTLGQTNIADNGAKWTCIGLGTGAVDVPFEAEVAGPVGANAGALIQIATPVSGWQSVYNVTGAVVGTLADTDAQLRLRREDELAGSGNSTPEAIRARILKVNAGSTDPNHTAPTNCTVFHNDTDATNANGVPPHSVEVLVTGGTDADIAKAVFQAVAAGIRTYGNQTSTVTDSQGNTQTVYWSRPTNVPIYVVATVYYDPSKWPTTNTAALVAAAAKSALLTWAESYYVAGVSVRSAPLAAAIIDEPSATDSSGNPVVPAPAGSTAAPGIVDVSPLNIGTAPSPGTSTPVAIAARQLATFSATNITITAVAESP